MTPVVAVGMSRVGDALLATRLDGTELLTLTAEDLDDACLERMWGELGALHAAGIAHGAIDPSHHPDRRRRDRPAGVVRASGTSDEDRPGPCRPRPADGDDGPAVGPRAGDRSGVASPRARARRHRSTRRLPPASGLRCRAPSCHWRRRPVAGRPSRRNGGRGRHRRPRPPAGLARQLGNAASARAAGRRRVRPDQPAR